MDRPAEELLTELILDEAQIRQIKRDEDEASDKFDSSDNKKLTQEQVSFFKQAFYSRFEEVDIFYCTEKELDWRDVAKFTDLHLYEEITDCLHQLLENLPYESDSWK